MSILVLVLLGLVQGLCEFLPISSSGHLVLLSKLFKVEDSLFVSIILHVATLLALMVVMRKEIFYCLRHPFSKQSMTIVVSTIITCIVAIVLMPFITASFEGVMLPVAFLGSAILLFLSQKLSGKGGEINYKRAGIIGFAQGLAIFPGLSRSGTTISAGLLAGGNKEDCAKFSFLISLPIVFGSLLLEIVKLVVFKETISVNWLGLALAFLIAFVVGILTIKFMLKLTKNLNFKYFSIYLVIIAIVSAVILW
ncbi:MAG: undecaprenyl-diphosphate phosphatase [Clostridia bacterium]|jgi:undecaprenyl-diphosphatase|nr:undecaprenyl-diphosphate phosphatase [Clostridia bacterium]